MRVITCIEDLRLLARRRVPRMFYDYVDSGSWTESTYRANERDLAATCFRQRVAVNIENRSVRSTMIARTLQFLCGIEGIQGIGARPSRKENIGGAHPFSQCRRPMNAS
jgi:isopentenyl diphosphate isomerase/L-lactate dehydrogenase-like FMN-dependent dehydrogenase